jgi:DNA-binding CsgD family transcriptional regulator
LHPARAWELSPREQQAVELYMVHGNSRLVAPLMGITPKTVEIHLGNAKEKSGFAYLVPMALAYDRALRSLTEREV